MTFISQDIIAIGIAVVGYFCGAIPMAVYAAKLIALQPVQQSVIMNTRLFNALRSVASSAEAASVSFMIASV